MYLLNQYPVIICFKLNSVKFCRFKSYFLKKETHLISSSQTTDVSFFYLTASARLKFILVNANCFWEQAEVTWSHFRWMVLSQGRHVEQGTS